MKLTAKKERRIVMAISFGMCIVGAFLNSCTSLFITGTIAYVLGCCFLAMTCVELHKEIVKKAVEEATNKKKESEGDHGDQTE